MNTNEYPPEVADAITRNVSECIDKADEYDAVRKHMNQLRRDGIITDREHFILKAAIGGQIDYWLEKAEQYKAMRPAPEGFDD